MREAELGGMNGKEPQVKERGSWKSQGSGFSPGASRRNAALPAHFRLLTSATVS